MRAHHWIATGPNGIADFQFVESEVAEPGPGEVTITVQASGVNPADLKHPGRATVFPVSIGYEVAGTITALGPETEIASGGGAIGDAVLAFRVTGGWASILTVPADTVFARPQNLGAAQAANLLLVATTATDLLRVAKVESGETVVVFGASGSVGVSLLQIARSRGIRVVGVCSANRVDEVARFGGVAIERGQAPSELAERIALAAADPIAAVFDASGRDDDIAAALAVAGNHERMVTIVETEVAKDAGFQFIGGVAPENAAYRASVRAELIDMAARGDLVVPVSETFVLRQALDALDLVSSGRAGGKVALVPDSNDV